ncbi:MAG: hypothetical protein K2N71_08775, partial [Oscillospiraceae bacterium]|nr:hypothetical protein [Oscillospiraceae bacterium]
AISSAVLVAVLGINVSAEEVVGFDYAPAGGNFVRYDFTAEDGATGTLTYTKDEDGKLYFSSYTIDAPAPESPKDFPNYKDPDKGYWESDIEQGFAEYFAGVQENNENRLFEAIVVKFDVSFDPPIDDVIRIEGGKCYVADLEAMTVHYVGFYCIYESIELEDAEPDDVCEYTAEDGAKFYLYFSKESGEYSGCVSEEGEMDFAIDNVSGTVTFFDVETGYKLYSDPNDIPLAENEVLVDVDFEKDVFVSDHIICAVSGKKFYVVTLDGMNSKVRYMGHSAEYSYREYGNSPSAPNSDFSDGATTAPKTGNGGGYLNIMLAAAGLAVLAKRAKK